jgi:glycosyltransferase involved in cell wall biosynthesis
MTAVQRRLHDSVSVLQILTRLNIGGPAQHAALLSRVLPRLGFDTRVVAGQSGSREGLMTPAEQSLIYVPALRRDIRIRDDIKAERALRAVIQSVRPLIVHTHMSKAGTLGRVAARRMHVPIVVHSFHGHVLEGYFSRQASQVFISVERALARWTDALIAVSPTIRDELIALGVGSRAQWHVIPLGLDLGQFRQLPHRASARHSLGLDPKAPVVGIVGRLVPVKNHEMFLRVASVVAKHIGSAIFAVVGDGQLRDALQSHAKRISADVRFLGWVHDLGALYSAIDIVVSTSSNEGTPTALIEAAAARRPVVATDVGGVRDVVQDGRTGFLVPPGDVGAMAERVRMLVESRELARTMGENGRELAFARFTVARLGRDIAALYRELFARSDMRPDRRAEGKSDDAT